jgi:carbamate kinase
MNHTKPVVIALGGNALLQRGQNGTFEEQYENVKVAARKIVDLIEDGFTIAITHGNGPQVGATMLRHDAAFRYANVPSFPMHACGAETQGFIGYLLQQALQNEIEKRRLNRTAVTLLTRTLVSPDDPAFKNPTKPVGPFYTRDEAERIAKENPGLIFKEDAGRGWRRVVPSPEPREIVEWRAIKKLVEDGYLVISTGGGGIPVTKKGDELEGVDAVIDKDLAAEKLATLVRAGTLLILTDVDGVYLDYGSEKQTMLTDISYDQLKRYLEQGKFASGSMKPKVLAALRFIENGGEMSVIASLNRLSEAAAGFSGTRVRP